MNKQKLIAQIEKVYEKRDAYKNILSNYSNVIILGNGGSNSIASHISQDYTKQLGKRAFTFSDPSRLTCYINDYGQQDAYTQFLSEFYTEDTLVVLISSSGESGNILNCQKFCETSSIPHVVLSGFSEDNKLNTCAKESENCLLHVHVVSFDYGIVENVHQIFLHSILETNE